MKNITEFAGAEPEGGAGFAQLFQRLAHDLRQPLSNIECIGYYLDMVLGAHDPEVQRQCAMLRRMVQRAHWVLQDASLVVSLRYAACGPVSLSKVMRKLSADTALHDERNLELRIGTDVVVIAPIVETACVCNHLLSFYRNIAQAEDPICVTVSASDQACLEFSADVAWDMDELLQMVQPVQGGALQAFAESVHGHMSAKASGRRLTLSFQMPRIEEGEQLGVVRIDGVDDEEGVVVFDCGNSAGGFDNPIL